MQKTDHIPLAEIELVAYEILQKDQVKFSCPCSCCCAFWAYPLSYCLLYNVHMCPIILATRVPVCDDLCITGLPVCWSVHQITLWLTLESNSLGKRSTIGLFFDMLSSAINTTTTTTG